MMILDGDLLFWATLYMNVIDCRAFAKLLRRISFLYKSRMQTLHRSWQIATFFRANGKWYLLATLKGISAISSHSRRSN